MRKILASDYDGTFYIDDNDIKKNINKVKEFRDKRNVFIIATGRSYYDFGKKFRKFPFQYDYLIINHGATILNNKGDIIANYSIQDDIKEILVKDLDLCDQDNMFVCKGLEGRVSIKERQITKIHKRFETFEKSKEVNDIINKKYGNKINSYLIPSNNAIEIISSKTNKAKAIQILADIEQIKKDNIYTIGDSYNDIEMLTSFNGCCMENAENEIKKRFNKKYKGVSYLIDELLGGKDGE